MIALLLFLACADTPSEKDTPAPSEEECPTLFHDADGDGFGDPYTGRPWCVPVSGSWTTDGTDCDDDDAETWPGAAEDCDGQDHDCDGNGDPHVTWYVDEDGDGLGGDEEYWACEPPPGHVDNSDDCDDEDAAVAETRTWYADEDNDNYGDPGAPAQACARPSNFETDADDCDDTDSSVHPGAREYCDLQDDDCDGEVDEDATNPSTWYADADGDGFGDPSTTTRACYAPPGYTTDTTDCDDADATTFPGAPEPDCSEIVDHNCDGSLGYSDRDGDGSVACDDCDDGDATRGPTMPETCDGEDDDCDGDIDEDDAEDALPWYTDEDGDGYGTDLMGYACEGGPRLADSDGDCDDGDPALNPGEREDCSTTADDDCDGDTNDENASGCTSWYPDADGDGYGDERVCTCTTTTATAANDDDCDDGDATANPGATEVCGTGVDEDCAGSPECGVAGALVAGDAAVTIVGADSNDYLGYFLAVMDDLDGDGVGELVVGASGLDDATSNVGGYLVFAATASGTLGESDALAVLLGEESAGRAVAGLGDTDGDGVGDLALGDPSIGTNQGRLYVVSGADLSGEMALADQPMRGGLVADDGLGGALAGPGDVDGDSFADVLVGATGVGDEGAAYLFAGPITGTDDASTAVATLEGTESGDNAGEAVAGGDLDGDGLGDVVIAARSAGDGGAVYLLHGPLVGTFGLEDADAVVWGVEADDGIGYRLALGDMDGDGSRDLAVGAPTADDPSSESGRVHVFAGPLAGHVSTADATATVGGESPYEYTGIHVAFADLDTDGCADLVTTSRFSSTAYRYGLRVFPGPLAGALDSAAQVSTLGGDTTDSFGTDAAAAGDVDGDGFDDLWTSAPYDDDGASNAGAAYLFYGGLGP